MNKQELIEAVIELPVDCSGSRPKIDQLTTLELIKLLDQPEKLKIPKFVADYIEFKKENNYHVYGAMRVIEDHHNKRVPEWFFEGNVEKFCLAWIFGYEVENEKRYLVKLKGIFKGCEYLNFKFGRVWTFSNEEENEEYRTCHTKKELEDAGFGWVFDCPGVEVEEVE